MAVEKTRAVVLKVSPYRESSCLCVLLTRELGLVHGVAKGIRRKKSGVPLLERGFGVELLVYVRPHRDLHTLASIAVSEYYPSIRADLHKSALRDMAFECIVKTMSCDAPHPDVYAFCADLLSHMERHDTGECFPALAWQFFYSFSSLMGFRPILDTCCRCRNHIKASSGAFLSMERGVVTCEACAGPKEKNGSFLPAYVLDSLHHGAPAAVPARCPAVPGSEIKRIIRLFAGYCQYHFQNGSDFKSLAFTDSLLDEPCFIPVA
jgi:DNA repair protein RecO